MVGAMALFFLVDGARELRGGGKTVWPRIAIGVLFARRSVVIKACTGRVTHATCLIELPLRRERGTLRG
jgi:hypothetical protein